MRKTYSQLIYNKEEMEIEKIWGYVRDCFGYVSVHGRFCICRRVDSGPFQTG